MSAIPLPKPDTKNCHEDACAETIISLRDRVERVERERRDTQKNLDNLRRYCDDLNDAIIIVDNKRVSLWSIYESGDHFLRCKACAEVECEGCERG